MATKSRGLGKGLDALIAPSAVAGKKETEKGESKKAVTQNTDSSTESGGETLVKITLVEPNPNQPRKNFDDEALAQLADSIKQHGIFQPITVQDRGNHYEIIAGERRWRAAKLAGLKEVPVIIKHYTEEEIFEIALIENLQREDLNPIEEALAYKQLSERFNLKQEEVAEKVSKSRSAVTNSMRLLKLCDKVQQMIVEDKLSTGHARAIIPIEDEEQQLALAEKIVKDKLSVRDVEKLIKNISKPTPEKKVKQEDESLNAVYRDIEEKLKAKLGTKVSISPKGDGSGSLNIEFYSHDDLEHLIEVLS